MQLLQVPIEIRVNDTSEQAEDDNATNVHYEVVGSNQILTLPSGDPVSYQLVIKGKFF